MMNRNINKLGALILALGIVGVNARAANSPEVPSLHQITWVRIFAFTDVPLADGDVAVYDTAGRLLFQKRNATNDQGVFPARVRALPRNFRVTIVWDGHSENNSERLLLGGFTLSADVENFDPAHGIVYVNPVTTMVSRLLDRSRGGLTLSQAQDLVRRFLVLPQNASLGAAMRDGKYFRSRYFSQKVFLTQAVNNRGVETFLEALLNEMLEHSENTHSFASAAPGAPGGIASWLAEKLAGAAVSWAAGQGCGWVAKQAGLITPGATVDDITALQNGLAELQSSVDELNAQMKDLTQQLSNKIDASDYRTTLTPALALAAQVNGVENDLMYLAQQCPALTDTSTTPDDNTQHFCTNQKATVLGELNDLTIIHSYETLTTYVLDNPALLFNGIIHQFSLLLGENVRFFRPADSTKVQNTFDYWDSALTQAANLKVELLHVNGAQDTPGGVKQLTDFLGDVDANPPTQGTFQNTYNSELQVMFPAVPQGTVLDTKTRFMWRTDYPTGWGYCVQGTPSIGNGPITNNTTWNGMVGWTSPFYADLQTLVDGGGSDPMSWLIGQTKAVAPDSPLSPGFADIVYAADNDMYNSYCTNKPWVWSVDTAPPINGNPAKYLFDFKYATKTSAPTGPVLNTYSGYWYWLYIRRPLERDEQYYWYQ